MLLAICSDQFENFLRQLWAADQQVGKVGVLIVVVQAAAIETAAVQASCGAHTNRGRGIPFVLSTGVDVGVSIPQQHVHGLGACGTH